MSFDFWIERNSKLTSVSWLCFISNILIMVKLTNRWLGTLLGLCFLLALISISCDKANPNDYGYKVVACVPVYGQSLALGEEAVRITDFDTLRIKYDGRIVTERLDYEFGYFDYTDLRVFVRRLFRIHNKSYELSAYGMAEDLVNKLGEDTIVCIFPGGQGLTDIEGMVKGTEPYSRFLENIVRAYNESQKRKWHFYIPAICWMQGESDIVDYPKTDYRKLLKQFSIDINQDIKSITHQKEDVKIVCYQTSALAKGWYFKPNNYYGTEAVPSTQQMELIRDDSMFWASGPTYPYSFVNENLHIDGLSQNLHGHLAAKSVLGIIRNEKRIVGLLPNKAEIHDSTIRIHFNVPCPPLKFDTSLVKKISNYGFSVVRKDSTDIVSNVEIHGDTLIVKCNESPIGCRLRYGVNGEYMHSGNRFGARGNLRDSYGDEHAALVHGKSFPLYHWCYIFDIGL